MINTYTDWNPNNPINSKEMEKTYEDFIADLSKEDYELLENKFLEKDYEINKYKSKLEFARIKERDVKEFFTILDNFIPKDLQDQNKLITLAEKIRNNYGINI